MSKTLHEEVMEALEKHKDKLPERIKKAIEAPPVYTGAAGNPWAKPEQGRAVAIAALFILRCSYGQLMALFGVSQGTVYSAVTRHVSNSVRQIRGRGHAKPLIPYELATQYFQLLSRAGQYGDAVRLAATIKQLSLTPGESENEDVPHLRDEAGDKSSSLGQGSE